MRINNFIPSQEIFNNGIEGLEKKVNKGNDKSFESVLKNSLDKLNEKQIEADNITNEFIAWGCRSA